MYKVFFNDRTVFLTDNFDHLCIEEKYIFFPYTNYENLIIFLDKLQKSTAINKAYIYHQDLDKLMVEFKSIFDFIVTAGGLVMNNLNQILFIKRLGKWDLPKGKPKKNETIENTAIREVQEECGITKLAIKDAIYSTYHTYTENNKKCLKKTHWYSMFYDGDEELVPQEEEDISFVKWFNVDELVDILINTYPSIIDLLKIADIIKQPKKARFN